MNSNQRRKHRRSCPERGEVVSVSRKNRGIGISVAYIGKILGYANESRHEYLISSPFGPRVAHESQLGTPPS